MKNYSYMLVDMHDACLPSKEINSIVLEFALEPANS